MWTLHWLEAKGDLGPWKGQISSEIEATREVVADFVRPPRVDILIQRGRWVIQEIGLAGRTFDATLMALTIDPESPNFAASLSDGALRRQVAHEIHHCLRWAGPGYGRTLGEALVSEGLAGQFVGHLFGTPPEIWERAVEPATADLLFPDAVSLRAPRYDHMAWFYGTGGYPKWLGYTIGYRMAGAWLRSRANIDPQTFIAVPAADVLAAGTRNVGGNRP